MRLEHAVTAFVVLLVVAFFAAIASAGIQTARIQKAEKDCAIRGYSDYDNERGACYKRVYEAEGK